VDVFEALQDMPAFAAKLGPDSFLAVLKDITVKLEFDRTGGSCTCALFWPFLRALLVAPAAQELQPDTAFNALHMLATSAHSTTAVMAPMEAWLHHLTQQQAVDLVQLAVQCWSFAVIPWLCSCTAAKTLGRDPVLQLMLQTVSKGGHCGESAFNITQYELAIQSLVALFGPTMIVWESNQLAAKVLQQGRCTCRLGWDCEAKD
jgi:hypothetical protein